MVVAMMPPLVLSAVRATSRRSLWHRRDRAIGGFLVGYLAPWIVAGLAVGLGAAAVAGARGPGDLAAEAVLAAVAFAVAAAWQLTAVKRRAMWSCHRTVPLAPDGWRADRDCVRYGWVIGRRCLLSCWAMMLACVLAGSVPVMAGMFVLGATERYTVRPRYLLLADALAVLALVYTVRALTGG
jgi:predicted metal-binding membrane protein